MVERQVISHFVDHVYDSEGIKYENGGNEMKLNLFQKLDEYCKDLKSQQSYRERTLRTDEEMLLNENVKMFLFARWLATSYADTHLDGEGRSEHDEGFDGRGALSVLNRETGFWYREQIEYFNRVVYPNFVKNNSVKDAKKFLENENT